METAKQIHLEVTPSQFVHGIHSCPGFYIAQGGITISGGYECGGSGSGTWTTTPSYTTDINVCQFAEDTGQSGS